MQRRDLSLIAFLFGVYNSVSNKTVNRCKFFYLVAALQNQCPLKAG